MSQLGYFIDKYSNPNDGKIKTMDGSIEKAKFILFAIKFSLSLMPGWNKNNNKPLCYSNDGRTPSGGTHQQIGTCADCQLNSWNFYPDQFMGRAKMAWQLTGQNPARKPCSDQYTVLGFNIDTCVPFTVNIHGSAIKYLQKVQTQLLGLAMKSREKATISEKKFKVMLKTPIELSMEREGGNYAARLSICQEQLSDTDQEMMSEYYNLVLRQRVDNQEQPSICEEKAKNIQANTKQMPSNSQEKTKLVPGKGNVSTKKTTRKSQGKSKAKPRGKTKKDLVRVQGSMFNESDENNQDHRDPA